jgi:hypothetical protein
MAKSARRLFGRDDLLGMVQSISERSHSLVAPQFPDGGGPAPGPGDVLNPGLLPPLFTPSPDTSISTI